MTQTHSFELIKKQRINEIDTEALLYKHIKTGAELLSLINDDENKVFGITFRTPPNDSSGVAHILEHSVLCGSRKYPVKEPFVELMKSSLQTFLNAMTYPDKTCYPVASQNIKDFYNLVDVYLDAVFYPGINPYIFQQEGWHYNLESQNQPLEYKGVVFNEMKGAYSSPDNLLSRYSQQSLFPDVTYGLDSGGDPKEIPGLTYEAFKNFHEKYYHPTNSRIFFYGDDNPEERLRLTNQYLKNFDMIDISSRINLQSKFNKPKKIQKSFIAGAETGKSQKGMITVNWLLCENSDLVTNFAIQVLSFVLLDMPASPLRKALIESGLGEGLAGGGVENEIKQIYFSVGLKGIDILNSERVEELIIDTLSSLAKNGIDPLIIEAALNTIEFALRENNTGKYPRGLAVMIRVLSTWLYDADPLALITFDKPLKNLKNQYDSNPSFFENIIDNFFIKNTHRTTVVLKPDVEQEKKDIKQEQDRLEKVRTDMSDEEILQVINNTKKLREIQETPDTQDALATIPSLMLSEMEKKNKNIPLTHSEQKGVQFFYHDLVTNGIVYLDIGLNLNALPQKFFYYIPVFGKAMLEMGTEKEDFSAFSLRINRKTGGIRKNSFSSLVMGAEDPASWLFFRSKALMGQVDDLLDILRDMLLTVQLDNPDRFKQIVLESKSGLEQSLIPAGSRIINLRIRSHFNNAALANEQMAGLSSLFFLRDLVDRIDNNWQDVLNDIKEIRRILVNRNNMIVNITVDKKNWKKCEGPIKSFVNTFPVIPMQATEWSQQNQPEFEGLIIPSQVNYVGKGMNLYKMGYRYSGSVNAITRFLRTNYLWERIRVQGGAYGAMCQFERMSGVLTFLSYRDPNLQKTLKVYDEAALYLKNITLSDNELHRCIIGTIGDIDSYMLPDLKGYTSLLRFLIGNTDEIRQQMRDEVLQTKISDFRTFAEVIENIKNNGITKILGGQGAFDEAYTDEDGPDFLQVL